MQLGNYAVFFCGKDLVIDVLSALVLLLILLRVISYYRANREEKKHLLLIASFAILTLSFVFKVLSHSLIYYSAKTTRQIGLITLTYQTLQQSTALVFWGLVLYRALSLLGFYLLFLIYTPRESRLHFALTAYLVLVLGYLSHSLFNLYYFTAFLLLAATAFAIGSASVANKNPLTRALAWSVSIIAASQLVFMLAAAHGLFYIAASLLQLCGYAVLLTVFLKVIIDGKKRPR